MPRRTTLSQRIKNLNSGGAVGGGSGETAVATYMPAADDTRQNNGEQQKRIHHNIAEVSSLDQRSKHHHRQQQQPIYRHVAMLPSPIEILQLGLSYSGYCSTRLQKNNTERKIGWFKSEYGVEPTTVAPFFQDFKNAYSDINFKDFLMTMDWIFGYETYQKLSKRWNRCVEYIGPKVIEYGLKMAKVAKKKIIWELKHDVNFGRTVDCVTFMCNEMRQDPSTAWFDYKTHSCGLKYECGLATREAQIVWVSGPHIPSMHDITVFRGGDTSMKVEDRDQSALYFKVKEGEYLIGDSGYNGEPDKIVVTKDEQPSNLKEFLARAKNRQETFHTRLKSWNILGTRFRHGKSTKERMRLHKMAVELVSGIVQYDYENGHPPFDIC